MPFPTLCHRCGSPLTDTLVCLECRIRYRFDQALSEHLTLRHGPFLIEGKAGQDAGLCCLARSSDGDYYLQSINWRTGDCYPALRLSIYPGNYPANVPVVDWGGRLLVPLGGSHEIAIVESPVSSRPSVHPLDLRAYGKPLACMLDSQKLPVIVYIKSHKVGLLTLDANLRPVGGQQGLPELTADNQELIQVSDQRALFRLETGDVHASWKIFDASSRRLTSVTPSADPGERPIPCSSTFGQVALAGRVTLRLVAADTTVCPVQLPDNVTRLSAVAMDSRRRLYFGVNTAWGEQAEGAALYFPSDDGVEGYSWASLPTRPQHILLPPESPQRALVLAHNNKNGTYLLSIDLASTRTDTLASVPPSCCGDRLVVQWPAAAFGAGNMIYKRPIYRNDDTDIPVRPAPVPRPAVAPAVVPRVVPGAPPAQPVQPEAPRLNLIVDLQSTGRAEIGDVCLVTLLLKADDQKSKFCVRRVAPAAQGSQTWLNYQCGNPQFSREKKSQHTGSVQLIFKQTGQIPVTLEITIEDANGRWQMVTKSSSFQVDDPLRRPPGTYYNASGDMIVINRTNS